MLNHTIDFHDQGPHYSSGEIFIGISFMSMDDY
jgi:hypothetical protein